MQEPTSHVLLDHIQAVVPHVLTPSSVESAALRKQIEGLIVVPKLEEASSPPLELTPTLRKLDAAVTGRIELLHSCLRNILDNIRLWKTATHEMVRRNSEANRAELQSIHQVCSRHRDRVGSLVGGEGPSKTSAAASVWEEVLARYNREFASHPFVPSSGETLQNQIRRFLRTPLYSARVNVPASEGEFQQKLSTLNHKISTLIDLDHKKRSLVGGKRDQHVTREIENLVAQRDILYRDNKLFHPPAIMPHSEDREYKKLARELLRKMPAEDNSEVLSWKLRNIVEDQERLSSQSVHQNEKVFVESARKMARKRIQDSINNTLARYRAFDSTLQESGNFFRSQLAPDNMDVLKRMAERWTRYTHEKNNDVILRILDVLD